MTVPSSTSSSSERGWPVVALLAVAVFMAGVIAWEFAYAALGGERQAVVDDAERWSDWRERAAQSGRDGIILVGASRMQLDVDLATLEQWTDRPVFQLAIDGTSFIPVLLDLALDPRVNGTVVVSVRPPDLAGSGTDRAAEWVSYYRYRLKQGLVNPAKWSERRLAAVAGSLFPSRANAVRPETLFRLWSSGRQVENYLVTFSTREREADYSRLDIQRLRQARLERSESWYRDSARRPYSEVESTLALLQEAAARIRQRGGEVIFVRMPVSDEIISLADKWLPKARYLGRIEAISGARFVDAAVQPSMRGFALPDGSHLDRVDQEAFTRELARLLFPNE